MSPEQPDRQPEQDRKPLADRADMTRAWEILDRWKAELDQFDARPDTPRKGPASPERQMPEVRKLASDASTEVGDVRAHYRAHNKLLEALRKTQLETREDIARVDTRMDSLEAKVDKGFATMNVGMMLIAGRLGIEEWESDES